MWIIIILLCPLLTTTVTSTAPATDYDQIVLDNALLTDISGPLIECLNLCVHSVNGPLIGLSGCYDQCHGSSTGAGVHAVPSGEFNFSVDLICTTDTQMTLQITSPETETQKKITTTTPYGTPGLYAIEINSPVHVATYLGTSFVVHLTDLQPKTEYAVSGFVIGRTNRIEMITDAKWTTLPADFLPSSVTNISVAAYDLRGESILSASIYWMIPSNQGCFYTAMWHSEDDGSHPEQKQIAITSDQAMPQSLAIDHLRFGTVYRLSIRGVTSLSDDAAEEGPLIWMDINTPTCLEWSGYDLEQCPPATPERLTIAEVTSHTLRDHYDIQVTWKQPKATPDNYTIQLVDMDVPPGGEEGADVGHKTYSFNITSGNTTSYSFRGMALFGTHFEVVLIAHSIGGSSAEAFATKFFDKPGSGVLAMTPNQRLIKDVKLMTLFLLPVAILAGVCLFGYHVYVKRRKLYESEDACLYSGHVNSGGQVENNYEATREMLLLPIDDAMECARQQIQMLGDLGEGEFGLVKLGRLRLVAEEQAVGEDEQQQQHRMVAIKMLKPSATTEEMIEFRKEIDMMKSVGAHQHIVSIVGHYTRDLSELMLLTEYCPRGNLLNYLRANWKTNDCCYAKGGLYQNMNPNEGHAAAVENRCYQWTIVANNLIPPTQADLLVMAHQIASGMEYLARNRVIHRDLAARNVLLCDDRMVKIADFGLSRDIYQNNVYRKTSNGKLPIKWMAIESLSHQIYTSQSDVWSYGILLYELMTFGSVPYPSVSPEGILQLLASGYRMEQPENCHYYVYDLMLACWNVSPNNRPHFASIVQQVEKMLEATTTTMTEEGVVGS